MGFHVGLRYRMVSLACLMESAMSLLSKQHYNNQRVTRFLMCSKGEIIANWSLDQWRIRYVSSA